MYRCKIPRMQQSAELVKSKLGARSFLGSLPQLLTKSHFNSLQTLRAAARDSFALATALLNFYCFPIFSVTVSPFFRKKQLSDNLLSVSSITYGIHVSAVISQPPSVSVKTKASFLPQGMFLK